LCLLSRKFLNETEDGSVSEKSGDHPAPADGLSSVTCRRSLHPTSNSSRKSCPTPAGLGPTVSELGLEEAGVKAIAKTCFSMAGVPEIRAGVVDNPDVKSVVLCGIETHACIHHTTLELMEAGKDVHIVVDCCSSRSLTDRKFALDRLRDIGAFLTTSEGIILSFAPDAAHPNFKQIQKLVIQKAQDTGLLNLGRHE